VRRQRVARKAGQNIGAGGFTNLAAAYAPMVFHDNQNLLNTMQHQQMYMPSSSAGGFVHMAGGAGALFNQNYSS